MFELKCNNCNKIFYRKQRYKNNHCFCCKECELTYKHNLFYFERECPICKKIFETTKVKNKIYCSLKCQIEWQKQNPRTKENHPCYDKNINHTIICQWCNKEFETGAYRIKHGIKFCSNKCRQEWFAKEWSQTEEWKEISRIRSTKILTDNLISKTNSGIQIIINNVLDNLNIDYKNEKNFKYFSVDNYLIDYNLCIENMGTYWHCDHRKYKKIIYENHIDRIKRDKSKRTYIINNYNINLLYLWETDINNNLLLCEKLIKLYISNNGVLNNYQSFNYKIINDELILVDNIEKPFMDYDISDLNKIIDIKIKEKISKKQKKQVDKILL
jgi:hypothetical protein